MLTRRGLVTMMLAGLACGAPAAAQQDAAAALAQQLDKDLDPALIPRGYEVLVNQRIAIGDEAERQKMVTAVNVLLEKTAAAGSRSDDSVKESIYYFIFGSPAQAAAYEADWEFTMAIFAAQMRAPDLDRRSRRLERRVDVKTAAGPVALRCRAMDGFIGCLAPHPGSPVVIGLVLQEPGLSAATDDEKRAAVLEARLRKEADGLLKAAQVHLAGALRGAR